MHLVVETNLNLPFILKCVVVSTHYIPDVCFQSVMAVTVLADSIQTKLAWIIPPAQTDLCVARQA